MYLLDPKDLPLADALAFLHKNTSINIWHISHLSESEYIPPGTDSRDPVVPVCHQHTLTTGSLANHAI
jgi:hypothetical protein